MREAVMNAFAHRIIESRESVEICIYKSTITISSYGTFPKGLTPQAFIRKRTRPVRRNPLIAQTLYYSKDMESHATGLKRIQDACDAAGSKVAYERSPYDFTVIFHRHCGDGWGELGNKGTPPKKLPPKDYPQKAASKQGKTRELILAMVKENPDITKAKLANALGISVDGVGYHIRKMTADGLIKYVGSSRKGHWEVL